MDKAIKSVASHITPVNVIVWGVIPAAIVGVLTIILLIILRVPITGSHKSERCDTDDKGVKTNCRQQAVSNKWYILVYILVPLVAAAIAGGIGYKIGFAVKNPKMAVGIEGVSMMRGAITGQ